MNENADIANWTGRFKEGGTLNTSFTLYGHLYAGAPNTIEIFEPNADMEKDAPVKTIAFKVTPPAVEIVIMQEVGRLERLVSVKTADETISGLFVEDEYKSYFAEKGARLEIHSKSGRYQLVIGRRKSFRALLYAKGYLDKPEDGPKVQQAKRALMQYGMVPDILRKQREAAYLKTYPIFYTCKYQGLVWQLIVLAEMGAEANPQIIEQCEYLLNHSQETGNGGFAMNTAAKKGGGRITEVSTSRPVGITHDAGRIPASAKRNYYKESSSGSTRAGGAHQRNITDSACCAELWYLQSRFKDSAKNVRNFKRYAVDLHPPRKSELLLAFVSES